MNEKAVIKGLEDVRWYLFLMGCVFASLDLLRLANGIKMNLDCAVVAWLGWACVLRFLYVYRQNRS